MVAVDATGVGAAVVDLLRPKVDPAPFYAVTITSGNTVTKDGASGACRSGTLSVRPRSLSCSAVSGPKSEWRAEALVDELQAYRVTIAANGHDTYGNDWREAPHDDLVLALLSASTSPMPPLVTRPRSWGATITSPGSVVCWQLVVSSRPDRPRHLITHGQLVVRTRPDRPRSHHSRCRPDRRRTCAQGERQPRERERLDATGVADLDAVLELCWNVRRLDEPL